MDFDTFRTEVREILEELTHLAGDPFSERIQAAMKRLLAERLKIVVVGEFSRGKSTFVNALTGEPILPSRVNPTTATVSELSGASPRQAFIEWDDGSNEVLQLPTERVNAFLNDIVTVANVRSAQIRRVKLHVPGRLELLRADIVDTPGVNDLDQLREDITFRILREADAVIVVIDSQQPVTESERDFLKNKVTGSDINRMLFVLNRIDEAVANDGDATIDELVAYAEKRLTELAGIDSPRIFPLSAKEALRARFRNCTSQFLPLFEEFESSLIRFAEHEATTGRMLQHVDRVRKIAGDVLSGIVMQLAAISAETSEIDERLEVEHGRLRNLQARLNDLDANMASQLGPMKEKLQKLGHAEVISLQASLSQSLQACSKPEQIDGFRDEVSRALRSFVETISHKAWTERSAVAAELEKTFAQVLRTPSATMIQAASGHGISIETKNLDEFETKAIDAPTEFETSDAVVGGILGTIVGVMFGGLPGIVTGLFGAVFANSARRDAATEESIEAEKERLADLLEKNCQQLKGRIGSMADVLAKRELDSLGEELKTRVEASRDSLKKSIALLQEGRDFSEPDRQERRELLDYQASTVRSLIDRCDELVNTRSPQPAVN